MVAVIVKQQSVYSHFTTLWPWFLWFILTDLLLPSFNNLLLFSTITIIRSLKQGLYNFTANKTIDFISIA